MPTRCRAGGRACGERNKNEREVRDAGQCERCALHGAARCGWTQRRPRAARQKRPCERASHTGLGGTGECGFFVVHCSWSWLALAVQLLLHCCGASPRSPPPPRTRARGVRESKRASSARIPRGGTGAGDGRGRRWRTAGEGAPSDAELGLPTVLPSLAVRRLLHPPRAVLAPAGGAAWPPGHRRPSGVRRSARRLHGVAFGVPAERSGER